MNAQEQIIGKIINFQKKQLLYTVFSGIINLSIYLLLIWISTFLADSVFYFSPAVRWFILIINVTITFYLLYQLIISPLIKLVLLNENKDLTPITRHIGELFSSLGDKLTNIYQLIVSTPLGSSLSIRQYAIEQFANKISSFDFNANTRFKNFVIPYYVLFPVLIGSVLVSSMLQDKITLSMKRTFDPTGDYAIIPWYQFTVNPGNSEIIAGEPVNIITSFRGPEIKECLIWYRNSGDKAFQSKRMQNQNEIYTLQLNTIKKPLEYFVQAVPSFPAEWRDKLLSPRFTVNTLIPPLVTELQLEIIPPTYTKLPRQMSVRNVGDVIAYAGSKINIHGQANKPLKTADIVFSENNLVKCLVRENKFNANFTVKSSESYIFRVKDDEDLYNQNPIEYSVTTLADQFPTVDILEPGEDIEIAADGAVNLLIEGNDDFGFDELKLHYQIIGKVKELSDTTWQHIPIFLYSPEIKHFQQLYLWNFANLPVSFEDVIKYYITLSDNDLINGPKTSQTPLYYIRFPSVDQLFDQFGLTQNENIEATEDLAEESEKLKKDLEEISREMKREKEIDWERKKSLESALERQKKIQDRLEKIEDELNNAVKNLENNQLFSPEVLEKYHQLQDLFQEIATPELLQAMKDLQKSIENINQKNAQQSLQKFKLNQEQFKANLDRTLALFEKVKLEQELDRLVKMSNTLEKEQEKISETLNNAETTDQNKMQSLIPKEENQKDLLQKLTQSISDLMKKNVLKEYPKTTNSLNEAQNAGNQIEPQMNDLSQALTTTKISQASQLSDNIGQQLNQMHLDLQNAQQQMLQTDQQKIMSRMEKITDNLLKLSKNEENIIDETKQLSKYSDKYPEVADRQQRIIENMSHITHDIVELSHETFFLPPQLSKSLGSAYGNMKKSVKELENRRQGSARNFQKQSMGSLNRLVLDLQQSMEKLAQAGSALGFEQYLEQMQKLSGKQGQLNQESLNFFKGNSGTLSAEQQGQLKRMAARQAEIQKSLQNLEGEMQGRSDVLGRLDHMANEMSEVIKDLQAMQVDRNTIERQQKILSRMLDAQKSVREKEYSKKRLAEIGKNYSRKSPGEPTDVVDQKLKQLNLDLMKALQEGYNPDYERLIEEYFRTLNTDYFNH